MEFVIQSLQQDEWILLHDFYFESPEPDSPKKKFEDLSDEDQQAAAAQYRSDNFKAVFADKVLVGFVGFFPDDDDSVNLFCVIAPVHRGKGYFSRILQASLDYCRTCFAGAKYMRGLTRKENTASIRGLEQFSFVRKGSVVEEVQPDIVYEEYLLPI